MLIPGDNQAIAQIVEMLGKLVGEGPSTSDVCREPEINGADAEVEIGQFTFLIEWKGQGTVASVARAITQVQRSPNGYGRGAIPLVAVPYMGPSGMKECEKAGVSWVDLSGNARISAPGLHINIQGRPNLFIHRGRPSSAFAPKSSRITRWLLIHPKREMSQREIASATDMSEGFTSKIVARLAADRLVVRTQNGKIKVKDPNLLLDAWAEKYRFDRHRVIRGHVPSRTTESLLANLSEHFHAESIGYAATGLSAAWQLTHFAAYRIVSVYIERDLPNSRIEELGFREDDRGANTWLVIPNDRGVFQGSSMREGVRCVHPVQVYLDLLGHPERASEAADRVRSDYLKWANND